MKKRSAIALGVCLLFLPLIPAAYIRGILPLLLEFPLRTHHVVHPPYSPAIFAIFSIIALMLLTILIFPRWFGFKPGRFSGGRAPERQEVAARGQARRLPLPIRGYIGILICGISWICAWNRFVFLGPFRDYTFFPLWLGYILSIDAFVFKRSGSSILHRSPRTFVLLFPASALAWWYFEYLNRFVQNWWYMGVEDYTALHYALLATLSFSTVFPAVFETKDFLCTFRRFKTAYADGPTWFTPSRNALWFILAAGAGSLLLTGIYPSTLFFMTWFSPLIILGSTLALAGVNSPLSRMRRGDYTEFFALAAAALICGFFWEMWNFYSMPKWYYSIPYVMKFKLFEMPAPGYGGYLPFGPICWLLWIAGTAMQKSQRTTSNFQHPTFK